MELSGKDNWNCKRRMEACQGRLGHCQQQGEKYPHCTFYISEGPGLVAKHWSQKLLSTWKCHDWTRRVYYGVQQQCQHFKEAICDGDLAGRLWSIQKIVLLQTGLPGSSWTSPAPFIYIWNAEIKQGVLWCRTSVSSPHCWKLYSTGSQMF